MSLIDQQIEEVETTVEHAKEVIAKASAVRRLAANKDFQLIVDQGYNIDEAVRLAHLVSDPRADDRIKGLAQNDLQSLGAFKRYLGNIIQMGDMAEAELARFEDELDYLRSDEGREAYEAEG